MTEYIICYDVSNPKRLGRLFRYLRKCAVPLQYSVFLFTGDDRQLDRCMAKATGLIDAVEDDLRAYPLPVRGLKARLGKPALPEGIQMGSLPAAW
jgi:CRISPR-associated protein Cas2